MTNIRSKYNITLIAALGLLLANILALGLLANKVGILNLTDSDHSFSRLLATHVELAILIWLPGITLVAWKNLACLSGFISSWLAMLLGCFTLMLILAGLWSGAPVELSDYFPVVDHPVFIMAMLGISLTMITAAILTLSVSRMENWSLMLSCITTLFSMVLLTIGLSYSILEHWQQADALFWASGHIYQLALVYTLCLLWLGERAGKVGSSRIGRLFWCLPLLIHLLVVVLYFSVATEYIGKDLFTISMEICTWWPPMFCAYQALVSSREKYRNCLILSIGLFLLAILFGFLIVPNTLIIPAHYHAVLSAINIGAFYYLLNRGELSSRRTVMAYGAGMLILASGIGIAGILGEGRKIATLLNPSELIYYVMGFASVGGLIALLSSLLIALSLIKIAQNPNPVRSH